MKGILADINVQGHLDVLVDRIQSTHWKEIWDFLGLQYFHFGSIGLLPTAPDSIVWDACQANDLILVTDNRNQDGTDSLESTIQSRGTSSSLPIFTIGNRQLLRTNKDYAERVIESMLELLLRIDELRGTGRMYLP